MLRLPLFLILAASLLTLGGCANSGGSGGSAAASSVPVYEVTAGSLNMRQEPNTSGAVVGSLKQGTRVQGPHGVENGWLYVETDAGASGYVSARYVRSVGEAAAAPAPPPQQTAKREPAPKKEAAPPKEPAGRPAPAGSRLARVELGMSEGKVASILGQPTSQENYQTGKAWIPYYYGSDTSRLDYKYKGVGVVVFGRNRYSGKTRVIQVDYDPTEDGY
jgi:hypothetical protein